MNGMKRSLIALAIAAALGAGAAQAQIPMASSRSACCPTCRACTPTSAARVRSVAAQMAVEDFGAAEKGIKVEIVSADHQNKPDVGSNIARQWYDVDKVDAIFDVPNSAVALAVNQITKDKGKAFIVSGAASSDLTGKACSPNTVHWTYDTWMLANGTGSAIVKTGGDTWFFLTADYAFGHALERDTEAVVLKNGRQGAGQGARIRSTRRTSRRSCCRRRRRRPRSSVSPMPVATRPTRSSRRPSSASSRAARTSRACSCSCPISMRWACRLRRG